MIPVPTMHGGADPVPVVCIGAGVMGRAWVAAVEGAPDARLVGVADLDPGLARAAAEEVGRADLPVGADGVGLALATGARAVVDATAPPAHHPVTTAALLAGLAVLGEKPVAATLPEALSLVAASEVTGGLFVVSQSRRWNPGLAALRAMAGGLGRVGMVTTEFFKAPRFGGFRDEMADPLLVDMAIHAFDAARYLLDDDPVTVTCEAWNPPWSWYAGRAAASAVFEMAGGARFSYTGSWCSPGAETSWNGSWRVSGERGSALWDGEGDPVWAGDGPAPADPRSPYSDIAGSLQIFLEAVRTGDPRPPGEVHGNVLSLAMVEAAVESADRGGRVRLADVMRRAHAAAVAAEEHPEVRLALLDRAPSGVS